MSQAPYSRPAPTGDAFSFQVFSEAWNLFKEDWQPFVFFGLSSVAIPMLGAMLFYIPYFGLIFSVSANPDNTQFFALFPLMFLGLVLLSLGSIIMQVGWLRMAFHKIDHGTVEWKDGWRSMSSFWGHFAVSFLAYTIISIGFMVLYIPGLIATAILWLAIVIYADPERRNRGVIDALKESRDLTRGSLLYSFLFYFVTVLIAQLGGYVMGLGVIVTAPIAALAAALQKRRREALVYGQPAVPAAAPPPTIQP
jgi:hypothetical protein